MTRGHVDLHLLELGGRFDLTSPEAAADFRQVADLRPHVAGITEAQQFHNELAHVPGYQAVFPARDLAFLIRDDVKVLDAGGHLIYDAPSARDVFVGWVRVDVDGEDVSVALVHFLAHQEEHLGRRSTSWRVEGNRSAAEQVLELLRDLGRGRRLAFLLGDLNGDFARVARADDRRYPQTILTRGGAVAVWSEVPRPGRGSHGRRLIDFLFRWRRDGRVRALRGTVRRRGHSDHRIVDAVYRITRRPKEKKR